MELCQAHKGERCHTTGQLGRENLRRLSWRESRASPPMDMHDRHRGRCTVGFASEAQVRAARAPTASSNVGKLLAARRKAKARPKPKHEIRQSSVRSTDWYVAHQPRCHRPLWYLQSPGRQATGAQLPPHHPTSALVQGGQPPDNAGLSPSLSLYCVPGRN